MSETLDNKLIMIREDYVDAAERCALLAESMAKQELIDLDKLKRNVDRWRKLRKSLITESQK